MDNQCAVGVFSSIESAREAIHILDRGGVESKRISLVTRHIDDQGKTAAELNTEDDSLRDAVVGSVLGSVVGVLGDAALFVATGLGAVLVAGPLALATGAVVGGLIGAMEGWGVHKTHLARYESLLHEGKALVVVDGDPLVVADAERMLRETDASEVHLHAETSDDAPEIDDAE